MAEDEGSLYWMPADSDAAIVAFSGKGVRHFEYHRALGPVLGVGRLLVRDLSQNWYNAGLPDVGETIDDIAERLREELAARGVRRVITMGASMGGYAAILFGCMLGAERAIAIGPQTLLDPAFPHAPPAETEPQAPDLLPFARAAPDTEVDIVIGWDSLEDVFHAQRLRHLPSVRVLAVPNGIHDLAGPLYRRGKLLPLIEQLMEGHYPEFCILDPQVPPVTERLVDDAFRGSCHGDLERAVERLTAITRAHPGWAGAHALLGRCLLQAGKPEEGRAAMRLAAELNPSLA
jgi:pimeloyl-ACP methyl ester carboxylesterase